MEQLEQARHKLAAEVEQSIETLVEIRDDPEVAPAVRERAARTILDRSGLDSVTGTSDDDTVINIKFSMNDIDKPSR